MYTDVRTLFQFDRQPSESSDALSDEINVNLCDIFFKLHEDWIDGLLVGQSEENLKLFDFDVVGIVVRAKEDFYFSVENQRAFLNDNVDVLQDDILELVVAVADEGDQGLGNFGTVVPDDVVVHHIVHELHDDPYRR